MSYANKQVWKRSFNIIIKTKRPSNEKSRLDFIGKENDNESSPRDFGVRKYETDKCLKYINIRGHFTCPDPLWEQYYGSTPYHYAANNPVSLVDPRGFTVIGVTTADQKNIKASVEDKYEKYIIFEGNGSAYLDSRC